MGFFKSVGKMFKGVTKPLMGAGMGYLTGGPIGGLMGAMSGFGGSGGGGGGNYGAGMEYLNQIPGIARSYLNPYTEEGRKAYNSLLDQYSNTSTTNPTQFPAEYSQMGRDPTAFMNNLMKDYEPSRGYNYKQNQMLGATRNSAASGGFSGTQYDQANQAETIKDLLGSDMAEYLSNVLNIQKSGLEGEERRLAGRERVLAGEAGRGGDAAHDLASILGTNLGQQAGFRFEGERQRRLDQANKRNSRMGLFGDLLSSKNQGGLDAANGRLTDMFSSLGALFGG